MMKQALKQVLRPLYRAIVQTPLMREIIRREAMAPWDALITQDFVHGEEGKAYGVTVSDKARLVECFQRNTREIKSGTNALVHTILAREILAIPPSVKGDVIECGVWKGASSASLSLVCSIVGRRLLVCDSFEGLPDDGGKLHVAPHFGVYGYYKRGMFCGSLDEVRENIRKFGDLQVCDFIPGFFSESLELLSQSIAFAFLDVDLVSSMRDCLRYIWPLLVEGGAVYTDDAGDMDVVRVFFDGAWWQQELHCSAPGYIGSGCGLPLNPKYSPLGYTRNITSFSTEMWERAAYLHYPDEQKEEQPTRYDSPAGQQ